jgi:hypothetical protein
MGRLQDPDRRRAERRDDRALDVAADVARQEN